MGDQGVSLNAILRHRAHHGGDRAGRRLHVVLYGCAAHYDQYRPHFARHELVDLVVEQLWARVRGRRRKFVWRPCAKCVS
jgi:hypothetical protein